MSRKDRKEAFKWKISCPEIPDNSKKTQSVGISPV